VPASRLDRHNLRTEWALCLVLDAPAPWDLLLARYGPEHSVRVHRAERQRSTTLAAARGADADLVVLDPLSRDSDLRDYATLPRIAEKLRMPDGCPWDRSQTHASLRPHLLEEAYEALDALDDADLDRLADELGDLLFQVVIHAQLASEEGAFDMGEVVRRVSAKLIRRHPHVFRGAAIEGDDLLLQWERIKRAESDGTSSAVGGLPASLPALFMTERLLERAERLHVRPALESSDDIGERLFALVAEGRRAGIDAEEALRRVNRRFAGRFERLEAAARRAGRELETLTETELAELWSQAR
jgi:tetrapyrrole methylase family protein / MazG family protein